MVLTHKSVWKDFDACIIIDVSDEWVLDTEFSPLQILDPKHTMSTFIVNTILKISTRR
eukprot:COSAG06_NODE_32649_length_502_cov_1.851117_1_plen_57_part_10